LDELRRAAKEGQEWIAELEETEKKRTGIKTLRVGYNTVFGYYIEVSKTWAKQVPRTTSESKPSRLARGTSPLSSRRRRRPF